MWNLLGGALGALGSIYGAQQQAGNVAATNQANMAMDMWNIESQQSINQQNLAQQLNFAQNSRTWGAEDVMNAAHATGLNPLSLLGLPSSSYSNQVAPQANIPMQANKDAGAGYAQAGQALGRAIGAIQSPEDQQYDQATKALSLQKGALENEMLRSQINRLNAPGNPPGVPDMSNGTKKGVLPDVQLARTPMGEDTPVPPREIAQLGFFHPSSLYWSLQNMLLPTFGMNKAAGHESDWFNPATGTYSKKNPYWNLPSGGYGGSYDPSSDPWR